MVLTPSFLKLASVELHVPKKRAKKKVARKNKPKSMLEVYERQFELTGSDVTLHRVRQERCNAGRHCACRPLRFTHDEIAFLNLAVNTIRTYGEGVQVMASLQNKLRLELKRMRKEADQE